MKRQHYLMMSCLWSAVAVSASSYAKDSAVNSATSAKSATTTTTTSPTASSGANSATTSAPNLTAKSALAVDANRTNKSASSDSIAAADRDLMRKLAFANSSEIATANLALKKSSNQTVKTFAQHMIDDHTKASEELMALAQRKNVALPTGPDPQHSAASKKMALLSGSVFDQLYLHEAGVVDHRATLELLEDIGAHAKDKDLKALAQKMAPTVVAHLDMVQKEKAGAVNDTHSHDAAKENAAKENAAKGGAAKTSSAKWGESGLMQ